MSQPCVDFCTSSVIRSHAWPIIHTPRELLLCVLFLPLPAALPAAGILITSNGLARVGENLPINFPFPCTKKKKKRFQRWRWETNGHFLFDSHHHFTQIKFNYSAVKGNGENMESHCWRVLTVPSWSDEDHNIQNFFVCQTFKLNFLDLSLICLQNSRRFDFLLYIFFMNRNKMCLWVLKAHAKSPLKFATISMFKHSLDRVYVLLHNLPGILSSARSPTWSANVSNGRIFSSLSLFLPLSLSLSLSHSLPTPL